jgi:hypothetical protein
MIDPENIVTKATKEDIVDESTGMEEAMSKLSIGQVRSIPRPVSQVTITATSSDKTSQVKESDRDTADQAQSMGVDIVMNNMDNNMDNMVPVSAQHTTNNNNGGNASRRNESIEDTNYQSRRQISILTENLKMMKFSVCQAQERETRLEEYIRHVED